MTINEEALAHIRKKHRYVRITSNVVAGMGSCCGAAKPYIDAAVEFGGDVPETTYERYDVDGVPVYLEKKLKNIYGDDFEIELEKTLLTKRLVIKDFLKKVWGH
ncbi:CC/Se motif family (seleno)protein [Peptoniphilus equinus]|uniref:CC/Se motif family (Seleno)protein n=1 Tax=Peptoniphilus equinus TaxID=3016343 RepID=A0ABY7QVI3_9FIRM|nr:CC/Se motif family (seleno)protein [Peptoniphilus equinus]WBW50411.1 CC/Se motif family (seleno)protein [Peptoniphilus equinus]